MAGVITNTIHHLSLKTFRLTSAGPTALILALTLFAVLLTATGVSAKSLPDQQSQETPASSSTAETEDYRLVINIPSRTLWVYKGDKIIRYFPVGVGKPGFMTPVGQYSVISKVIDPGWENPYLPKGKVRLAPGDDNPLGTRWIGFYRKGAGEYGMHGTDNPDSVGKFSSHGCVRLKVKDAEALFEMVDLGTPVVVQYEPVLIRRHDTCIQLIVFADRFKRGTPTAQQIKNRILKQYPQAHVTLTQIQAALVQPNEKPIEVGSIILPESHILQAEESEHTDGSGF